MVPSRTQKPKNKVHGESTEGGSRGSNYNFMLSKSIIFVFISSAAVVGVFFLFFLPLGLSSFHVFQALNIRYHYGMLNFRIQKWTWTIKLQQITRSSYLSRIWVGEKRNWFASQTAISQDFSFFNFLFFVFFVRLLSNTRLETINIGCPMGPKMVHYKSQSMCILP